MSEEIEAMIEEVTATAGQVKELIASIINSFIEALLCYIKAKLLILGCEN
jgi:hypothetical protein